MDKKSANLLLNFLKKQINLYKKYSDLFDESKELLKMIDDNIKYYKFLDNPFAIIRRMKLLLRWDLPKLYKQWKEIGNQLDKLQMISSKMLIDYNKTNKVLDPETVAKLSKDPEYFGAVKKIHKLMDKPSDFITTYEKVYKLRKQYDRIDRSLKTLKYTQDTAKAIVAFVVILIMFRILLKIIIGIYKSRLQKTKIDNTNVNTIPIHITVSAEKQDEEQSRNNSEEIK